jgi:hypothetical protein
MKITLHIIVDGQELYRDYEYDGDLQVDLINANLSAGLKSMLNTLIK